MAVVEKRKNVWSALLINHLMFMIICLFIILPTDGVIKIIIGTVLCFMYYFGVHDYCHKAGRDAETSWRIW